jgi:hypothetical protein
MIGASGLRAEPTLAKDVRILGEVRVCDPGEGPLDWEAGLQVAERLQLKMLSMSSVHWILGRTDPGSYTDSFRGPAVFTVAYDAAVRKPSLEELLSLARSETTCGELRIGL